MNDAGERPLAGARSPVNNSARQAVRARLPRQQHPDLLARSCDTKASANQLAEGIHEAIVVDLITHKSSRPLSLRPLTARAGLVVIDR